MRHWTNIDGSWRSSVISWRMARSPSRKRSRDPWALIPDNLRWATDVALGLEFYSSDLWSFTIGADGLATQFDPGYPLERLYRKRLICPAHLVNVFMAATFDILGGRK